MAYWSTQKIKEWEVKYIGREITLNEYKYIIENEPGMMLLFLHVWNVQKRKDDVIKAGDHGTFEGYLSNVSIKEMENND